MDVKGEINNNIVIVGNYNTLLTSIDTLSLIIRGPERGSMAAIHRSSKNSPVIQVFLSNNGLPSDILRFGVTLRRTKPSGIFF